MICVFAPWPQNRSVSDTVPRQEAANSLVQQGTHIVRDGLAQKSGEWQRKVMTVPGEGLAGCEERALLSRTERLFLAHIDDAVTLSQSPVLVLIKETALCVLLQRRQSIWRHKQFGHIGVVMDVIAKQKDLPVAVMSKNLLGLSFHPEIDGIDIFHKMMFDKSSKFYFEKLKQGYAA